MRSLCQLKEVSKQTFYKGFEGIASQDEERQGKGGAEPKKYEFIPFWVSGLPCSSQSSQMDWQECLSRAKTYAASCIIHYLRAKGGGRERARQGKGGAGAEPKNFEFIPFWVRRRVLAAGHAKKVFPSCAKHSYPV